MINEPSSLLARSPQCTLGIYQRGTPARPYPYAYVSAFLPSLQLHILNARHVRRRRRPPARPSSYVRERVDWIPGSSLMAVACNPANYDFLFEAERGNCCNHEYLAAT